LIEKLVCRTLEAAANLIVNSNNIVQENEEMYLMKSNRFTAETCCVRLLVCIISVYGIVQVPIEQAF